MKEQQRNKDEIEEFISKYPDLSVIEDYTLLCINDMLQYAKLDKFSVVKELYELLNLASFSCFIFKKKGEKFVKRLGLEKDNKGYYFTYEFQDKTFEDVIVKILCNNFVVYNRDVMSADNFYEDVKRTKRINWIKEEDSNLISNDRMQLLGNCIDYINKNVCMNGRQVFGVNMIDENIVRDVVKKVYGLSITQFTKYSLLDELQSRLKEINSSLNVDLRDGIDFMLGSYIISLEHLCDNEYEIRLVLQSGYVNWFYSEVLKLDLVKIMNKYIMDIVAKHLLLNYSRFSNKIHVELLIALAKKENSVTYVKAEKHSGVYIKFEV